jgi:hypothetical protein
MRSMALWRRTSRRSTCRAIAAAGRCWTATRPANSGSSASMATCWRPPLCSSNRGTCWIWSRAACWPISPTAAPTNGASRMPASGSWSRRNTTPCRSSAAGPRWTGRCRWRDRARSTAAGARAGVASATGSATGSMRSAGRRPSRPTRCMPARRSSTRRSCWRRGSASSGATGWRRHGRRCVANSGAVRCSTAIPAWRRRRAASWHARSGWWKRMRCSASGRPRARCSTRCCRSPGSISACSTSSRIRTTVRC